MEQLASLLRCIQLYSQNAHNLVKGPLFMSDHNFLSDLYESAATDYDGVIERMIGLGKQVDLVKIQEMAVELLKAKPAVANENKVYFQTILEMKKQCCDMIEALCKAPGMYQGTIQLLGDISNKAEMEKYKLQQRIK